MLPGRRPLAGCGSTRGRDARTASIQDAYPRCGLCELCSLIPSRVGAHAILAGAAGFFVGWFYASVPGSLLAIASRRFLGVRMSTSRKRPSNSRSSSPLTMQSAPPFTANSRNLSSFGSRQAWTVSRISTSVASLSKPRRKCSLCSSVTYRRNCKRPTEPYAEM